MGYRVRVHEPRWTSQETAQIAHITGKRFAKVVLLRSVSGQVPEFVLAVLPAHEMIDLSRLAAALGWPLSLATEEEMARLFPSCEVGAVPPFGELCGIPVVADACLAEKGSIAFNGGTHTDVVEMRWADFQRLAKPKLVDYGRAIDQVPAA